MLSEEKEDHDRSFEREVENFDSSLCGDGNEDCKRSSEDEEHVNAPMLEETEEDFEQSNPHSPTTQVSRTLFRMSANSIMCKLLSTLSVTSYGVSCYKTESHHDSN